MYYTYVLAPHTIASGVSGASGASTHPQPHSHAYQGRVAWCRTAEASYCEHVN